MAGNGAGTPGDGAVLRVGTLGAARITPVALIRPARRVPGVAVVGVAARDPVRAQAFAARHGVPQVHADYESLLADPGVDAVYNPLPNGLHGAWTIAALEAGKHVLCEKPFTANAEEAEKVAAAAARAGRVVMEAFHYRYHPLAERMRAIVDSGRLGPVRRIDTWMCVPVARRGDIRYRLDMAGGAMMDVGSYAVHLLRLLAGEEPEVLAARARLSSPGVDRCMTAEVGFADGRVGRLTCSLFSARALTIGARVTGEDGSLRVFNPIAPQYVHRLSVRHRDGTVSERFTRRASYDFQLQAFADAALHGGPVLTGPDDAVANMRVIDAVYGAAGMEPRQPAAAGR